MKFSQKFLLPGRQNSSTGVPELPEVQTTVDGLNSKVLKRTFVDVWSDWKKMIRLRGSIKSKDQSTNQSTFKKVLGGARPSSQQIESFGFEVFKKRLKGKRIEKIWRRAKNVIFELSGGYSLLIHMKMTGHLMVGQWVLKNSIWQPDKKGPLEEKINTFLHLIFFLDNKEMIALSDVRKFAKTELWKTDELLNSLEFKHLGPEPMEKSFTLEAFKSALQGKKGKVKQVIMVPQVIAGIGNIYASEVLWWAKIHPEKSASKLSDKELESLYGAIKKVLSLGIKLGGESFADYRNVDGKKGEFDDERKVYKREKEKCQRCKAVIKRIKFGGRSAFFCPRCQKL